MITFLWILLGIVAIIAFITIFFGLKYRSPYKLFMVFGKKGSGKTTFLTKLAYNYSRKGYKVYCTDPTIANSYTFDPNLVGTYDFDQDSLVLIDEVSLIWSNRDFKTFSRKVDAWFRLMRHKKCICYLFSQSFDVDKKIRDLVDGMYLMTKKFNCIAWAKKIDKSMVLTEAQADQPSSIAENLSFESFLLWAFGSRIFTWIPKYSKMFDSFHDERSAEGMPATFTYAADPRKGRIDSSLLADDDQTEVVPDTSDSAAMPSDWKLFINDHKNAP